MCIRDRFRAKSDEGYETDNQDLVGSEIHITEARSLEGSIGDGDAKGAPA